MPIMPDAKGIGRVPLRHVNSFRQFLVSWSSKKQNYVALPTVEVEYVVVAVVVHNYFGCNKL
jgi:hypothetical protein